MTETLAIGNSRRIHIPVPYVLHLSKGSDVYSFHVNMFFVGLAYKNIGASVYPKVPLKEWGVQNLYVSRNLLRLRKRRCVGLYPKRR